VILINPYTGKEVDASEEASTVLIAAGFREREPEEKHEAPKRRGRPRKSEQ
jgi:hypothetical protein